MSTIIQNTTDLQNLLDKVNELPTAGSGGGDSNPILQDKTVTPTTSKQTIIADSGYDGLDTVTVNAIPSNYEDVGTETNAYTTKLASLESAITALETELKGKASGGSGGGGAIETVAVKTTSILEPDSKIYYLDGSMTVQSAELAKNVVYNVAKNTLFLAEGSMNTGCTVVVQIGIRCLYQATG